MNWLKQARDWDLDVEVWKGSVLGDKFVCTDNQSR